MRGAVAFKIDGLNGDLDRLHAIATEVSENCHLVLVAFAFKSKQAREDLTRESAQTGLGIGERNPRDKAEDTTGKEVAEAAAKRNVIAESAGTED